MQPLFAVYDACILYPEFLRNLLVHLSVHGRRRKVLRAKWTGRIHREWIRAVLRQRPDLNRARLARTRRLMDQHVRGSRVRGYQRWEQRLELPDANDRHVLAAALACVADVIVTFNISDFPPDHLRPFKMIAVEPDPFVLRFVDSGIVATAAAEHRASLSRPALSVSESLDALRRNRRPATAAALAGEPI
jgi:hypothetical protein